jgi:hypothetical protein
MPISQKALDLENRSIGINGEPTLAAAYEILKEQWNSGDRDRELGLHLMFLAWYGLIEPGHLTGFFENKELTSELNQMLSEVHDYFEPQIYDDAEMLYVFGLAANMFWYMFDNASEWEKRSIEYQKRYRALMPNGIDPGIFQNRGAYGEYYSGQAEIDGGY